MPTRSRRSLLLESNSFVNPRTHQLTIALPATPTAIQVVFGHGDVPLSYMRPQVTPGHSERTGACTRQNVRHVE